MIQTPTGTRMSHFVPNHVTCFGKISYIKSENKSHINVCLTKYASKIFK